MSKFNPGDQIKIGIRFKDNPFTHHGIYVGNRSIPGGTERKEDGVVHFEKTPPFGEVKIIHTNLLGFCKGKEKRLDEIETVNYGISLPSEEVVYNALECAKRYKSYGNNIFKKFFGLGYSITDFNCEHLATECRLGRKESLQGDLLKWILEYGPEIERKLKGR